MLSGRVSCNNSNHPLANIGRLAKRLSAPNVVSASGVQIPAFHTTAFREDINPAVLRSK